MKLSKIFGSIAGFLLLTSLLLSVIDFQTFRKSFYEYEYSRNNTAEYIGMSEEGLMDATVALLDYCREKRDDIVSVTAVNGYEREVFNERETLHMADVRNLYQWALDMRTLMGLLGAGLLAILLYIKRRMPLTVLKEAYTGGFVLMLILVGAIGLYAVADFTNFWLQFHYLFFDNDLFMLDPNTSIMINMFPETFFSDLVFRIIGVFALCSALIGALILIPYNRRRKALL